MSILEKGNLHTIAYYNCEVGGWICNCGAGSIPFGDRYSNREMRNHLRYSHQIDTPIVSLGARDIFMYSTKEVVE